MVPFVNPNKLKRALWQLNIDLKTYGGMQTFESSLLSVIAGHHVACVIDVGANRGQFGSMLRDLGYQGRIVSFEPNPCDFETLQSRANKDGNWVAVNVGLDKENGTLPLNIYPSSVFSSFREASNFGRDNYGFLGHATKREVQVRRLDELEELLDDSSTLLKMDTQGFDDRVYFGAKNILDRVNVIVSEIAFRSLYADTEAWRDSISRIERDGFRVNGIFPISHAADFSLVEANLIMVRSK